MKPMQELKLVVCDMAGTTVTDNHEVEMCFSISARKSGLDITDDEILSVQGWSKRHVFETFWERQIGGRTDEWNHQVDASYALFRNILEEHYLHHPITPTEGCLDLFSFLHEKGVTIALTTGFYRKVVDIILGKLGWMRDGIVDISIASDEVAKGRPEPDMIRKAMDIAGIKDRKAVINIGDTPSDIQSGKNAGVLYSCCVTNGTHSAEQLDPFSADLTFGSMAAFRQYLEKHLRESTPIVL
ncbi:HAD family hydrolase [Flavihumibacter petaseus]|uniref:Putative hydrolase n=1 Tax=Flavihumibacter petaseus NBRC 106054 TaxID=1220578 RepID=A0A0E9MY08_9BACT|nr:HAD family hydrolase [Flavihumibacter petaseus]GAO42464.1 putative hydrolase [Flavihumibacter petaseus NBRC 106054]